MLHVLCISCHIQTVEEGFASFCRHHHPDIRAGQAPAQGDRMRSVLTITPQSGLDIIYVVCLLSFLLKNIMIKNRVIFHNHFSHTVHKIGLAVESLMAFHNLRLALGPGNYQIPGIRRYIGRSAR